MRFQLLNLSISGLVFKNVDAAAGRPKRSNGTTFARYFNIIATTRVKVGIRMKLLDLANRCELNIWKVLAGISTRWSGFGG